MEEFRDMVIHIWSSVERLLSSVWGWGVTLAILALNYLGGLKPAFGVVLVAVLFDMFWGICAAVKQRQFVLSFLLRETFMKIVIYGSALTLVMMIERSLNDSWMVATKSICAIAAACELWSIFANILIVRPKTPFVRLFHKYLVGEISRKLNLDKGEIENCIKKQDDNEV